MDLGQLAELANPRDPPPYAAPGEWREPRYRLKWESVKREDLAGGRKLMEQDCGLFEREK